MILFLRFRRATLLLTRGMDRSLHHQQTLETVLVALRHQRGLAQATLPLGVLLGQNVPLVGMVPPQPTGPGEPDALAQGTLRFLLGHWILIVVVLHPLSVVRSYGTRMTDDVFTSVQAPSTCSDPRASDPARSCRCPSARWRRGRGPRAPGRCGPSAGPGTSSSPCPCCRPARTPARGAS